MSILVVISYVLIIKNSEFKVYYSNYIPVQFHGIGIWFDGKMHRQLYVSTVLTVYHGPRGALPDPSWYCTRGLSILLQLLMLLRSQISIKYYVRFTLYGKVDNSLKYKKPFRINSSV